MVRKLLILFVVLLVVAGALALMAVLVVVSGFAVMRHLERQEGAARVLPVDGDEDEDR